MTGGVEQAADGRRWLAHLAWVNAAITLVTPLLALGGGGGRVSDLWRVWLVSLVYANGTALPALLLVPEILRRLRPSAGWRIAGVVLGCATATVVGCLVGQAALAPLGWAVARPFWPGFARTALMTIVPALGFGLAAFFVDRTRQRLADAERALRDRALAEERARGLAAQARLQALEARLHPHFLFNTLNTVGALVVSDPPRAERLLQRLAALLRASLDQASRPLIALERELAIVEDYVELERARFGEGLRGEIRVPSELGDAPVPPLSVQSLVENAVKHGITPRRGGGAFTVSAAERDGELHVEVADTGDGFDLGQVEAGHGIDNLVGRLEALFGARARLNVLRRDGGCVVEMVVPRR